MNPRNTKVLLCVALVAFGCAPALAQELQPLYVPLVFAITGTSLDPGGHTGSIQRWESTMSVYNLTDSPGTVIDVAVYGKGAMLTQGTRTIQPHQGGALVPSVVPQPERGVGFLELNMSPGMVFSADVQRVTQRCEVGAPNCITLVSGQVGIPIYHALFPAGSIAVSGAVELGQFGLSRIGYSTEVDRRRRMNVTLFNAANAAATFVVRTFPHHFSTIPLAEQTVVVDPKDVLQINSFAVPTESSIPTQTFNGGNQIWVTITADQPFLSYVSTIFSAVEPGDLPFQVYPSYLQN